MNNNYYDIDETKYLEKSFGLTPADLLILEIKKPNKPIFQKSDLLLNKNFGKLKKSSVCMIDDPNYKNPKVRIKNIIINKYKRKYAHC